MRDDLARERAIESLRYGGQQGILAGCEPRPSSAHV